MTDPKEPIEFSNMDDFDNDGWGNTNEEIQERNPRFENEEIPDEEENDFTVSNNENFNCENDE